MESDWRKEVELVSIDNPYDVYTINENWRCLLFKSYTNPTDYQEYEMSKEVIMDYFEALYNLPCTLPIDLDGKKY